MAFRNEEDLTIYDPESGAVLKYAGSGRDEPGIYFVLKWRNKRYPFRADAKQFEVDHGTGFELEWMILEMNHGPAPQGEPRGGMNFKQSFDTAAEEREVIALIQEALTVYRAAFGRGKGPVRAVHVPGRIWRFDENRPADAEVPDWGWKGY